MYNCGTSFVSSRFYDEPRYIEREVVDYSPPHSNHNRIHQYPIESPIETETENTDGYYSLYNTLYEYEEGPFEIPSLTLPKSLKRERPRNAKVHREREMFVVRHAPHSHSKFCNERRACDNAPKQKKIYI